MFFDGSHESLVSSHCLAREITRRKELINLGPNDDQPIGEGKKELIDRFLFQLANFISQFWFFFSILSDRFLLDNLKTIETFPVRLNAELAKIYEKSR